LPEEAPEVPERKHRFARSGDEFFAGDEEEEEAA
jgi:hypothetical protein